MSPTGTLFVMDAGYLSDCREASLADSPKYRDAAIGGRIELVRADYPEGAHAIACYRWGLEPGDYNFPLNTILAWSRHPRQVKSPDWLFGVDRGAIVVADVVYLEGLLASYSFDEGFTQNGNPRTGYERELSAKLGAPEGGAFVQIASPGIQTLYEFVGDGVYFLNRERFTKAPRRRRRAPGGDSPP
jgi:hypothetical protein